LSSHDTHDLNFKNIMQVTCDEHCFSLYRYQFLTPHGHTHLHDALRAFDFLKMTRPEALVTEYFASCQRIRDGPAYSHNKSLTRRSEVSCPELEEGPYAPICLALLKLFQDDVQFVLPGFRSSPPPSLSRSSH
jgi:hypothetical protein